jgi:membrane-associated protein
MARRPASPGGGPSGCSRGWEPCHYHRGSVLNPTHLLNVFGALAPVGVFLILFAETGLLIGIVLPGDSLLFTAGLLSAVHKHGDVHLNLAAVVVAAFLGAVLGAQCGYLIGRKAGPRLFNREESRFFKRSYVERTRAYLDKYGEGKAVVLARFVPIVRTLMNPLAGVAELDARVFTIANLIGGLAWGVGVSVAGYFLGKSIPNVDRYLLPIIAVVVLLSLIPVFLEILRARRERGERASTSA